MDSYHVVTLLVDGDKLGKLNKGDFVEVRNVVIINNEIPLSKNQKKYIKTNIPHAIWWDKKLQNASDEQLTPIWPYTENCKSLWITMHSYPSKQPLSMRAGATGCSSSVTREIKNYDNGHLSEMVAKELNRECLPKCFSSPKQESKNKRTHFTPNPKTWFDHAMNYIYSKSQDETEVIHAWQQAVFNKNPKALERLFTQYNVVSNVLEKCPPEMVPDQDARLPEETDSVEEKVAKTNRCIRQMFPRWNVCVTEASFK
jgi:hypothetical protein